MTSHKAYTNMIKKNISIILTAALLVTLLMMRVLSHKYSLDTSHTIDILQNFLFKGELFSNIAGLHRFNLHFTPVYFLIAPTVILNPSIFIFLWKLICYGTFFLCIRKMIISNKELKFPSKNLFFLMILLNPTFFYGFLDVNIWDTDLTLPFVGLSLLALSRKQYFKSTLYFTCTYLVKEDMPLVGLMLGFLITVVSRDSRYILYSIFSLLTFLLITNIIMPSYSQSGDSIELLSQNFGYLGTGFTEILNNIITNPLIILESGYWLRKVASLFIIFMAVAFLPFLTRSSIFYLIPIIPIIGYAVLSNEPFLDYSKHYMLVASAFIVLSAINAVNYGGLSRYVMFFRWGIVFNIIIILLHLLLRNWSFYFSPISNFDSLQSAIAAIEKDETILTHGVGSPWIGHGRSFQISDDFSDEDLSGDAIKYILINKKVIFWEVLNDDQFDRLRDNLKAINHSNKFNEVFNLNDIILLEKIENNNKFGIQADWSSDLELYYEINQVKGKSSFVNQFRKL